ncbi:MAG TPA: ClC family H(+)/Cl(-) exchange transporter, partial [Phycisphaerales bacterium]|nr:ClC family H(+)/Cl(-) exchange transporter [Phycisphaerales bacterium]
MHTESAGSATEASEAVAGEAGAEVRSVRGPRSVRTRYFAVAAAIGLTSGLLAMLFAWALFAVEQGRNAIVTSLRAHPYWGWMVMPLCGLVIGCAIGRLVERVDHDAAGSGIPHVKGVLFRLRAMNWKSLIPVKFIGGVLGIGAGLSLGREGPTVQMGAAVGQGVGKMLGVSNKVLPQLISCGAGAGLSAAFNAPLAGFIFVIEELRREMSALTYGAALIAAVMADVVARGLMGEVPSFHTGPIPAAPLAALPAVILLGLVVGCIAVGFNRALVWSERRIREQRRVPRWALPGIAAALVGLIGWWLPVATGGGHGTAEMVLGGKYAAAGAIMLVGLL